MLWVGLMSTLSPMASSLCAPGTSLTLEEYGISSKTVGTLMISIYVLGYAVGPLFLAPLSEMYGRKPVINISSCFFSAFLIGCSFAPNMTSLIIMRLLAGIGGSAIMTIVSAVIGDVFRVHERAAASCIVIGTPSLAPISMQTHLSQAVVLLMKGRSWTNRWRIHFAVSRVALGVLDSRDVQWAAECRDDSVHAGEQSSNCFGEEDEEVQEGTRAG
jgi:MFS family permease